MWGVVSSACRSRLCSRRSRVREEVGGRLPFIAVPFCPRLFHPCIALPAVAPPVSRESAVGSLFPSRVASLLSSNLRPSQAGSEGGGGDSLRIVPWVRSGATGSRGVQDCALRTSRGIGTREGAVRPERPEQNDSEDAHHASLAKLAPSHE